MKKLILILLLLPLMASADQVGYTTQATTGNHDIDEYARANGHGQPGNGTLDSLVVWIEACVGECSNVRLFLYSNTGSCGADSLACNPDAILDSTVAFTPTNDAWNQAPVISGVSLTTGTLYWIVAIAADADPEIAYNDNVYGDDLYENDAVGWTWDDPNNPFEPDGSTGHRTYSMYWVYTPSGGEVSKRVLGNVVIGKAQL